MGSSLLRTTEAAERLGIAARTLEKWRSVGFGPRYLKVGGAVRYDAAELQRWLEARTRGSACDARSEAAR
jgi:excisionase family DNA binding protein